MKKDYITEIANAERRFFALPLEIEKREGKESRTITGYAAVFNKDSEDFGGWVERIAPGAFNEVLNDDAVALFNHDPNFVLARNKVNMTLSIDDIGLKYSFEAPNTTAGNDLLENIRIGNIQKSSFAFTTMSTQWDDAKEGRSVRTILKVDRLYDVSPVTNPAYPDTSVASRSFNELKHKDDYQIEIVKLRNEIFKLTNQ